MSRTVRRVALGAAVLTATGTLTAIAVTDASAATGCAFFDDFAYTSRTDPAFASNGWAARSSSGGPGVPGAAWSADNITFPTVDGQRAAQLSASTDGTAGGTVQAEFAQTQQRFFNGTYASRIKFQDTPVSGTDGDHVNETYFTIGPAQRYNYDPLYSELDFSEYLPNGGWGVPGPTDYETSWNGFQEDPWAPHNAHSQQNSSLDGWHTVASQVGGGHVKYFIDGTLVGDQTVDDQTGTFPVYPRVPMTLNYNLWFIDTAGHTGGTSRYQEAVDWTYYVKDATVPPADMVTRAAAYRSAGTTHDDTLNATSCSTTSPTTPPATTPTKPPTTAPTMPPTTPPTTPPTSVPPGSCGTVAEWNWGTVYLAGQRVRHNGHLWQANWWTQGSEPGLTAQWRDLGAC